MGFVTTNLVSGSLGASRDDLCCSRRVSESDLLIILGFALCIQGGILSTWLFPTTDVNLHPGVSWGV